MPFREHHSHRWVLYKLKNRWKTSQLETTHPLVEVFKKWLKTTQNTLGDANKNLILVIPRSIGQCPRRLNNSHQQTSEADTSKRCSQTTHERPHDSSTARISGREPPRTNGACDYAVGSVLNDLMGEEVRQEKKEQVTPVNLTPLADQVEKWMKCVIDSSMWWTNQ